MPAPMLAGILGLYAALVVWLSWPLGVHLGTHLPDPTNLTFDMLHTGWLLAYETHRLTTDPLHLLEANIYHPTPHALFYGETAFGALPLFAPVYLVTGNPTAAVNMLFVGGVTLTAFAIHLVVRRWTGSHLAGFVGAWTFLTNRWVLWDLVPSVPQYALLAYFPVIILLAATPARRPRAVLLLLALIVLQSLVNVLYIAGAVLIPLGLLALGRLAWRTTRSAGLRLLAVLALAAIVLAPVYAGHLAIRAANPHLSEQTYWKHPQKPIEFPVGLLGYQVPTGVTRPALILIVVGGLCFVGRRRHRATPGAPWAHALFWTFVGTALCLIPVGDSPAQLAIARWLPILEAYRVPVRLGIAALMGLALLAGLAFAECLPRLPDDVRRRPIRLAARAALAMGVAAAMYGEYVSGVADPRLGRPPLPAEYPLRRAVAADGPLVRILRESGGPLLELPVGYRATEAIFDARAMYRSTHHWRPLLNGYDGYWPAEFPARMALARDLPDPQALEALRADTGLAMILVNTADLTPEKRAEWRALTAAGGNQALRLVGVDGDELLFAVVE